MTYLDKGQTIDNQFYIKDCLSSMIEEVERQRPSYEVRYMLILHDNAIPYIHSNVVNFVISKGMKIIDQPPY